MRPNPELEAGDLDKRVTLLKPTYNEWEDEIRAWEPVAEVWAAIAPNFTLEQTESGRSVMITTVPIIIRHRKDVDARWRVREKVTGVTYEVWGLIDRLRRHAQLELACRQVE